MSKEQGPDSENETLRSQSLLENLLRGVTRGVGRVASGTLDMAADMATMSAMFGDNWVRDLLSSSASPERLEAMAEAGRFLRDARETAGLSLDELSETLGLNDEQVLRGVERGETLLPLETMLRSASLLARHDPIPFLIKFLRSYNPQIEATLEQWGVMALPKNYERERRFVNLYRQHDFLRQLSDDEYQRFVEYMDASTQLVVEMMQREGAARTTTKAKTRAKSRGKTKAETKAKATAESRVKPRAATSSPPRARAKAPQPATAAERTSNPRVTQAPPKTPGESTKKPAKPVVRKVKPRRNGD